MDYDYRAMMYYISAGDFSPLDIFFSEFNHKIKLYEDQTDKTLKLYQKDKSEQHAELKADYDEQLRLAGIKYKEVYEATGGSEHDRIGLATHESGTEYLIDRYAMECGLLDSRFADMEDIVYSSTIITLYTLLEAELKRLCRVWKELSGHKIALADFGHRDYTGASYKYLELVMALNMAPLEPFKNKMTDLQILRNRFIHDNGLFVKESMKTVKKLIDSSEGGLVAISEGDYFQLHIIKAEYVMGWFTVIRGFFEELFWLIDDSMNHSFTRARLRFLFGVLNNEISINSLHIERKGRKKELKFMVESSDFENLYELEVVIQVKDSEHNKVKLVNNVKGNAQADRLIKVLHQNNHIVIDRAFAGFLQNEGGNEITVLIKKQH